MGKIKGWTRSVNKKHKIVYETDDDELPKKGIIIRKKLEGVKFQSDWFVTITSRIAIVPSETRMFDNKEKALTFAKKYMRKYPLG